MSDSWSLTSKEEGCRCLFLLRSHYPWIVGGMNVARLKLWQSASHRCIDNWECPRLQEVLCLKSSWVAYKIWCSIFIRISLFEVKCLTIAKTSLSQIRYMQSEETRSHWLRMHFRAARPPDPEPSLVLGYRSCIGGARLCLCSGAQWLDEWTSISCGLNFSLASREFEINCFASFL